MTENPWEGIEMPEGFDPAKNPFLQGMKAGKDPGKKPEESRLEYIAKWAKPFELEHEVIAAPAVANGLVIVTSKSEPGSRDGHLYGIDAETGEQNWKFKTGGSSWSAPVVHGDKIFVGSDDNRFYAIDYVSDPKRALRAWDFPTNGVIYSTPAIHDGVVYFSTHGRIFAVNAEDGTQIWQKEEVGLRPVFGNDFIFSLGDNELYTLNAETGEPRGDPIPIGDIRSDPVILDNLVVVGTRKGIYAVNPETRERVWDRDIGLSDSMVAHNGVVYVGLYSGKMTAIDVEGDDVWDPAEVGVERFESRGRLRLAQNIENDIIHVRGTFDLVGIDIKTGKEVGRYKVPMGPQSRPTVYNGVVYVSSSDKNLHAFKIEERK